MTGWLRWHRTPTALVRKGRPDLPLVGVAPITLRITKPSSANTGAGFIRAIPTTVLNPGDTVAGGSWVGQVLTITQDLTDRVVNGLVKVGAPGLLVENNIIRGDGTTIPAVASYMVNTNSATLASPAMVRYNTMRPRVVTYLLNGIGNRNVTAEFNDMSGVTDHFIPAPSGNNDVGMTIRGNYCHDAAFYAPDPTHSATPGTAPGYGSSTGKIISGPQAGLAWNHSDIVQVEIDGTTGMNIYGNTFDARWTTDPTVSVLPLPVDQNGLVAYKELSCFMLNAGTNLIIEDNWLDGGEYCINNADATVTGVIRRNRMGRNMASTGVGGDAGYYAIVTSSPNSSLNTYDGTSDQNVWEDTGVGVLQR